ncbi:MAG TPA: tyrosine-type recombinase/integrase [Gemmataceae bacterium]|nr:tyrosine-type recombinase/integrase [Gemmataceae bacterium]
MSESNSTNQAGSSPTDPATARTTASTTPQPARPAKPDKPYPEYPLTPHPKGYWCKRIRGKLYYFGKLDDPDGALAKYLEQKDDLHAGRAPRQQAEGLTVKQLCMEFLAAKKSMVDSGGLSPRTWALYKEAADEVVGTFGKGRLVADLGPDDFAKLRNKLAKRLGPHGLGSRIQSVRCLFKYAFDADLVNRPVRYGPDFKRPSKATLRRHRAKQGPKLFTAAEVRAMVQGALVVGKDGPELIQPGRQLRAMLLLAINCGFGNADCGNLPLSAVNLGNAVIDYPRPKTGIQRRCPLWPLTVQALQDALAHRPRPKDPAAAGLVFITKYGGAWHRDTGAMGNRPISLETGKLLKALGINGRKGIGFYTLRHTFRTVADEAKDQPAADYIMGHEAPHMSSIYRETISDARLRAVADHVRTWLFAGESGERPGQPGAAQDARQVPRAG